MPYLVDGHNLIPKAGLRLDAPDDEMELVRRLQQFCRQHRKQVEVYFDGAPAGQAGTRDLGAVKATFVRAGTTADAAIARRLRSLGRAAQNWTVVSSDRQVQAEARAVHAEALSSEAFARLLQASEKSPSSSAERPLSSSEVEEWLNFFHSRGHRTE